MKTLLMGVAFALAIFFTSQAFYAVLPEWWDVEEWAFRVC